MNDCRPPGPEDRIFRIVRETLPAGAASDLCEDQSLLDAGLQSLDMVTLMLALEAEFDLEFPQHQMTPDNFRSVRSIGRLVAQLSASA